MELHKKARMYAIVWDIIAFSIIICSIFLPNSIDLIVIVCLLLISEMWSGISLIIEKMGENNNG